MNREIISMRHSISLMQNNLFASIILYILRNTFRFVAVNIALLEENLYRWRSILCDNDMGDIS